MVRSTSTKTRKKSSASSTAAGKRKNSSSNSSSSSSVARTVVPTSPDSIKNYPTAIRWLNSHIDYERLRIVPEDRRAFGLDRMRYLLKQLDHPHQQIKCLQVAGTKGKGSTCAMAANMLRGCGYTVGVYSSPHLVDLRERITVDDQMISHAELTEIFRRIAHAEKTTARYQLTFFEILTAAALRYFADQAVDIAILETGLGGRLDATTVVTPTVCGIAHISLDHTNVLGKDLASIAREKAGIFKKDVPAVSVAQEPQVTAVLNEVAQEVGAPLEFTGDQIEFSYRFEATKELGPHTRVSITTADSRWEHLAVPLPGEHQAHNCGLAMAMLDRLKAFGFSLPEADVISGLASTRLPGRMESVWAEPRVIIDGAHNAASIHALIRTLGAHVSYDSLVLIFGCAQNKEIDGMLHEVSLGADKVIFTQSKTNPRAMAPNLLLSRFAEKSAKMAQSAPNLIEALELAKRAVSREDIIVVAGSFYLAGEAKKHFANLAAKSATK